MSDRTSKKREYNQRTYSTHLVRIRADSALADYVVEYKATRNSLNLLITRLLCDYFHCDLPHRWYEEVDRRGIWPPDIFK